jgi:hypothetical protein
VNAIRAGDFPNKTSIAKDLKITPRTVQHYTVLLRSLGAPLEFDKGRTGFIFRKSGICDGEVRFPQRPLSRNRCCCCQYRRKNCLLLLLPMPMPQ